MDILIIVVVSLGAGFFMCLLLMALCTLLVQRRTSRIKRLNSRQVSWASSSLLVKRNKWLMVQHKRRQNLDLTPSSPQASQSLGSLASPYTNIRRLSSQNSDNYNTWNGLGMRSSDQNDNNMGIWVKEEPRTPSSLSLYHFSVTSSSLTLTTPATSYMTPPSTPGPNTGLSTTLNKGNFSDEAFRLRPLPQLPLPKLPRVCKAPSFGRKPIPMLNSL